MEGITLILHKEEQGIVVFEFSDGVTVYLDRRVKSKTYNELSFNSPDSEVVEKIITLPKKYRDIMAGPSFVSEIVSSIPYGT